MREPSLTLCNPAHAQVKPLDIQLDCSSQLIMPHQHSVIAWSTYEFFFFFCAVTFRQCTFEGLKLMLDVFWALSAFLLNAILAGVVDVWPDLNEKFLQYCIFTRRLQSIATCNQQITDAVSGSCRLFACAGSHDRKHQTT